MQTINKRIIAVLIVLCSWINFALSQSAGNTSALEELRKLGAVYRSASYLSFDVTYKYAPEATPTLYLDSLKGNFKINGDRYWSSLDNTESVSTADYMIMLFKEDLIMYI